MKMVDILLLLGIGIAVIGALRKISQKSCSCGCGMDCEHCMQGCGRKIEKNDRK